MPYEKKMDNLFELVKKYFHGEATLSERVKLMDWVEMNETNREEFNSLRNLFNASLMAEEPKAAVKARRFNPIWKWTAAAAVAIVAGLSLFLIPGRFQEENITCQIIEAPVGQRLRTVLSDSTVVWLNSGSKIEIAGFSRKERRVRLTGEAYWDVTKDPKRPFIVETSQIEVNVLGTQFNVDAYSNVQSVVLVSGSVKIKDHKNENCNTLIPNQKFTLDSDSGAQGISNVNAADFVTWTKGYLQFDNEPLPVVFDRLQQLYGIKIHYDKNLLKGNAINGKLKLYDEIEATLEFIKLLVPISYEKAENNEISIVLK